MIRRSAHQRIPAVLLGLLALVAVGCGGETPVQSSPPPMAPPETQPTPAPPPPPLIVASPTPPPECPTIPCEIATTNTAPPVRLTLRLYTVEDGGGRFVSQPDLAAPIPMGWFARLDVTGKDAYNADTNGQEEAEWHFSDPKLVRVAGTHTHQRRLQVKGEGVLDCWVTQQGVTSNTITLHLAR